MKYRNVYIIGGGVQGLVIAYYILKRKLAAAVSVYEASSGLGGLAGYIDIWGEKIDKFYHHYFPKDNYFLKLIKDLKLENFLIKRDFPVNYAGLGRNIKEKLLLALLLLIPSYKLVQNVSVGKIFDVLSIEDSALADLVKRKFGKNYKSVSLAWLWARIRARFTIKATMRSMLLKKETLYFLKPSTNILIEYLVRYIHEAGGHIYTNVKVRNLTDIIMEAQEDDRRKNHGKKAEADVQNVIILTTPLPVSKDILANSGLSKLSKKIPNVEYFSAINVLVKTTLNCDSLDREVYWEHLEKDFSPFVVKVAQHVVFDNLPFKLFYLGAYMDSNYYEKALKNINKRVDEVIREAIGLSNECEYEYKILHTKYASHLPSVEYIRRIPPIFLGEFDLFNYGVGRNSSDKTFKIYLSSFAQLFPWDRGVNYAIKQANDLVKAL